MKLINNNDVICLEFYSNSKLTVRSLKLPYTKANLRYATATLLPIFMKLFKVSSKSISKKPSLSYAKSTKTSLKSLAASYLLKQTYSKLTTQKTAYYALNRLFDFLPDKPLCAYTDNDLKDAVKKMRDSLSSSSVRLIINYLFTLLNYAKDTGLLTSIPISRRLIPKENKIIKSVLTPKQINALLKFAQGELKIFLYIAFYSGARSGEILALKAPDIDLKTNTISITKNQTRYELTTPKNHLSRVIPMPKSLCDFLISLDFKGDERLFTKDYFAIYYEFKKLLKSLKIPNCGLHITRHIYTSTLMSALVSPQFIAYTLGHSSTRLVNKAYSHILNTQREMAKVNKFLKF